MRRGQISTLLLRQIDKSSSLAIYKEEVTRNNSESNGMQRRPVKYTKPSRDRPTAVEFDIEPTRNSDVSPVMFNINRRLYQSITRASFEKKHSYIDGEVYQINSESEAPARAEGSAEHEKARLDKCIFFVEITAS